ncbi:MAG: flavin-containing monooxygenase [Burkholderiales bacterium]
MGKVGNSSEHFDVIVVGAGISGIGAAWHLKHQCPGKRYLVLEAQGSFGGTWITHRFPGIRSDSDLYTFGYRFKPWTGAPIATAAEILKYMGEVIEENELAPHIRYRHRIVAAAWSTPERRWTLRVQRLESGEEFTLTAGFLWMCQGYYRHERGYTPRWPGMEDFGGRIVHPQTWAADIDTEGRKVVVIGSGATAATIIPALAPHCAHVTMLQRSPTFFRTGRNVNDLADMLRALEIPEEWTHEIVRRKVLYEQDLFARRAMAEPEAVRRELIENLRGLVGDKVDVDRHFNPHYRPWQQRLAFVPDADLFKSIAAGRASVVTDEIERFTAGGLLLMSGATLDADIIVTATGFDLSVLGDIAFSIDGAPLAFEKTVTWRGAMFTGVPNLMWVFGYFRASWTLRVDLLGDLIARLFAHMEATGATMVVPRLRETDAGMELKPWVLEEDFNPGYLARGMHLLPRQGTAEPWRHHQDYWRENKELPQASLTDGALVFEA